MKTCKHCGKEIELRICWPREDRLVHSNTGISPCSPWTTTWAEPEEE